jgi:glycosyltransferase involved in cell wall biosynthesis
MSAPPPRISVVIPVLDGAKVLPGCLDALVGQRDAPRFEVIVVDNGSRDATAAVAREHSVHPRVVSESARGPYAARNTGIAAASGEIIAFTDADCVPDERWLAEGAAAIDGGAGLVGGAIEQRPSTRATVWERYDAAMYLAQDLYVAEQGFAATANLFVRAEVFSRLGSFRPELVASGDQEMCRRATAAGFPLVYAPAARIEHHPRATLRDTWALHRKLGSGFAELARAGMRTSAASDPALRISIHWVAGRTGLHGPRLRARQLILPHVVATTARWAGRLTGKG